MLKRILAVLFVGTFMIASLPHETNAGVRKGKWIDYYGGNSIPIGSICVTSFLINKCAVNDFRSNPVPTNPTPPTIGG